MFSGAPCPSLSLPPPEERKIIFRIVNFKHEKAVFNLVETGLNLHFANVCVLQRKEHACTHARVPAHAHLHTCTVNMHVHVVTFMLTRSLTHTLCNAHILPHTVTHMLTHSPGPAWPSLCSTVMGAGPLLYCLPCPGQLGPRMAIHHAWRA